MKSRLIVVGLILLIGVVLDLWTKAWAESRLAGKDGGRRQEIEIVEDYFHLTFVPNPHGAFSLFEKLPETVRRTGLIVASLLAVGVITALMFRPGTGWWMTVAFALVLSGAVGNLYDRVFLGYVRDFIDWHYKREFTWPTFNLADSYISVGVTILVVMTLFSKPVKSDGKKGQPSKA